MPGWRWRGPAGRRSPAPWRRPAAGTVPPAPVPSRGSPAGRLRCAPASRCALPALRSTAARSGRVRECCSTGRSPAGSLPARAARKRAPTGAVCSASVSAAAPVPLPTSLARTRPPRPACSATRPARLRCRRSSPASTARPARVAVPNTTSNCPLDSDPALVGGIGVKGTAVRPNTPECATTHSCLPQRPILILAATCITAPTRGSYHVQGR